MIQGINFSLHLNLNWPNIKYIYSINWPQKIMFIHSQFPLLHNTNIEKHKQQYNFKYNYIYVPISKVTISNLEMLQTTIFPLNGASLTTRKCVFTQQLKNIYLYNSYIIVLHLNFKLQGTAHI